MNATIVKIIALLFEDLEESEEVRALHEEMLTNCQERYADNIAAGMSEDDAIHDVMENLKGMEELLKDYPHRQAAPAGGEAPEAGPAEEELLHAWSCDPAQSPVHTIRLLNMGSADVRTELSDDGLIHVESSDPDVTLITGLTGGVLSVTVSDHNPRMAAHIELDFFDLSGLFEKLCRRLGTAMRETQVTLRIPAGLAPALEVRTSSGDVESCDQTFRQLTIATASGGITLHHLTVQEEIQLTTASGDLRADDCTFSSAATLRSASGDLTLQDLNGQTLQLTTASGDLEISDVSLRGEAAFTFASGDLSVRQLLASQLKASTASGDMKLIDVKAQGLTGLSAGSGDIQWQGHTQALTVSTGSGDAGLRGSAVTVSLKTGSGDARIHVQDDQLTSLRAETNCGDVDVFLPPQLDVCISCRSRTGDVRLLHASSPENPVRVELVSSSGDITVR